MKASDLLKTIAKPHRESAQKFLEENPPHPAELESTSDTKKFPANPKSGFATILLERERIPEENQTRQETAAIGIHPGEENQNPIMVFLDSWSPEEFRAQLQSEKHKPHHKEISIS